MGDKRQATKPCPARVGALRRLAAVCVVGIVATAAVALPRVVRSLEQDALWAIPVLVATEVLAWGGICLMLLAGGRRIGNPLTAKERLRAALDEATGSPGFRLGWLLNVAGATGTSLVIIIITVGSWPVNAWPLGLLGVVCSFAASGVPFYSRVWRGPARDAGPTAPSG